MGRPKGAELPGEADELRTRILAWRSRRVGGEYMPKELWAEGVRLARDLGACRVARAVGLDYMGLRRKLVQADERANSASQRFMEFPAEVVLHQSTIGPGPVAMDQDLRTTLEVTASDGALLRIQIPAAATSDLAELVSVFLRRAH